MISKSLVDLRGVIVIVCLTAMILAVNLIAETNNDGDTKESQMQWCYVGTAGGGGANASKGIYVCRFDPTSGRLTSPELAVEAAVPSFLAIHPNGKWIYATCERPGKTGVAAFSIDRTRGRLTPINQQSSGGAGACFVSVDAAANVLLVANFQNGTLASLPLNSDGSLQPPAQIIEDHGSGPVPKRQDGPHAHMLMGDPSHRFALACDLGTDQVLVFRRDSKNSIWAPNDPAFAKVPAGSGPRHLAFHSNHRFLYVVTELANTIVVFNWTADTGKLSLLQTISTLPKGFNGESWASEICVHPSGRYLYASNRGDDSIARFDVDLKTGRLTLAGFKKTQGKWPRSFQIDRSGRWLIVANEHSNTLNVFAIQKDTGELTATDVAVTVPDPSCVVLMDN